MFETIASFLFGNVTAGALLSLWLKWRERRRKDAAGSYLRLPDAVGRRDSTRQGRVVLKSWTGTPRGAKIALALAGKPPRSTWKLNPPQDLAVDGIGDFSLNIEVTPAMRRLPLFLSRMLVVVKVETIDARRKTLRYLLRSNRVDWSRPPDP